MASNEKSEFENVSGGWVGVQVHDEGTRGGFRGIAVPPGGRVWLDEEEQIATANKPREDKDNPFVNGHLQLTAAKQEMQNRRPIGDSAEPQAPAPEPQPEQTEQPPAEGEAGQKPESEMTQEEIAAHNAKAAAARAIPTKQPPASPPATPPAEKQAQTQAQAAQERQQAQTGGQEKVGTPEATAAAGAKPQGERPEGERVGTPDAVKK